MDEAVILALFIFICLVAATGIIITILRELISHFTKEKKKRIQNILTVLTLAGNITLLIFFVPIVMNVYFPSETRIDDNEQLQMLYSMTNKDMTEGLVAIEVVDKFPIWTFKDEKNTSGLYAAVMRKIYILEDSDMVNVYTHELGHHIWFHQLGNRAREIYIEEYNKDIYRPTAYANTSVSEDFADTFAIMALGDSTNRISKLTWRNEFMEEQVFVLFEKEEE